MSEDFQKAIPKQHYPVAPSSVKFWTPFSNCIYKALTKRGWKEVGSNEDWDFAWAEKENFSDFFDRMHLNPNQRVNHFRNHNELTRKDNLTKNLKRYKRALEKEGKLEEAKSYDFFPITYILPMEYNIFIEEFKRNGNCIWIMKPIGKSQGKGIFLFKKLSQIADWKNEPRSKEVESYVVQKYINNPLLIGGKKFDLRIYSLVTSYSPLTVYLYRDGFARFTHHRYDNSDLSNTHIHLTNVAVQKHSENYDKNLGGKWDLRTLKLYLLSKYGQDKVNECFSNIQQLIIKTFQAAHKIINNDKHCFELYGFDIMIDAHLKPWVLEVNGSPSMTGNTKHDCELKCGLLDDVFTIIDMEKILVGQEEQIGGFDKIYKGEPVIDDPSKAFTMLGCFNNRTQQIKELSKLTASRLAQMHLSKENGLNGKRSSKDGNPFPVILSTEPSSASRKSRSKSTAKPPLTNGSTVLSTTNGKMARTVFQKQVVSVAKEVNEARASLVSRESRESSLPVNQNRLKLFRGKTVHLPPVNANYSSLNLNSNTVVNVTHSTQLESTHKPLVMASQTVPLNSSGYGTANSGASTQSSQQASEGFRIQHGFKKQNPGIQLSAASPYQSKALSHPVSADLSGNTSIPLAGLLAKGKAEQNFTEAYMQNLDGSLNNLQKPQGLQRKLKTNESKTQLELGKGGEENGGQNGNEKDTNINVKESLKTSFVYNSPFKGSPGMKKSTQEGT